MLIRAEINYHAMFNNNLDHFAQKYAVNRRELLIDVLFHLAGMPLLTNKAYTYFSIDANNNLLLHNAFTDAERLTFTTTLNTLQPDLMDPNPYPITFGDGRTGFVIAIDITRLVANIMTKIEDHVDSNPAILANNTNSFGHLSTHYKSILINHGIDTHHTDVMEENIARVAKRFAANNFRQSRQIIGFFQKNNIPQPVTAIIFKFVPDYLAVDDFATLQTTKSSFMVDPADQFAKTTMFTTTIPTKVLHYIPALFNFMMPGSAHALTTNDSSVFYVKNAALLDQRFLRLFKTALESCSQLTLDQYRLQCKTIAKTVEECRVELQSLQLGLLTLAEYQTVAATTTGNARQLLLTSLQNLNTALMDSSPKLDTHLANCQEACEKVNALSTVGLSEGMALDEIRGNLGILTHNVQQHYISVAKQRDGLSLRRS